MKKSSSVIFTGHFPKKKLGQHFLKNQVVIHQIIQSGRFDRSDALIEIGPGLGALTIPLSGAVSHIIAVEKDPELCQILKKRLNKENIRNVDLINADILRFDLWSRSDFPSRKWIIIGNLPYNISSPLLEKLIEHREGISRAILMLQYEFAQRLTASPGSKTYGSLSVLIQYQARLSPLLEVSNDDFYPKPRVGSMVIEIDFNKPYPKRAEDEVFFKKTVRQAFQHKRKTLLNSLSGANLALTKEELKTILLKCKINPTRRAETLNIEEFLSLASALSTTS